MEPHLSTTPRRIAGFFSHVAAQHRKISTAGESGPQVECVSRNLHCKSRASAFSERALSVLNALLSFYPGPF